jgi:hypothetical protein
MVLEQSVHLTVALGLRQVLLPLPEIRDFVVMTDIAPQAADRLQGSHGG